jgi:hypothetical protein
LLCSLQSAFSQTDSLQKSDIGYIEGYSDQLNLRLNVNSRVDGFGIKSTPLSFDILPNTDLRTELSLNYRFLSLTVGTSPRFFNTNKDNRQKGETKSKRFNFNMNLPHLMQQVSYTKTKGYYLNNTSDYIPNWNKDSNYIQFPDLHFTSFYGNTAWKLNKNFTFNGLNSQTESQLKSAGTFLPSLTYHYYIINDKTPLTATNSTQKSNNFELLLNAGYYYTFVLGSGFYTSIGASAGGGIIYSRITTRRAATSLISKNNHGIIRMEGMTALGYTSERFFCGGQVLFNEERYNQTKRSNTTRSNTLSWQVFFGIHLNAPGKLKKMVDKLEQKKDKILKR